jgi:hypothetical protein
LEVLDISIGAVVVHLQSAVVCGKCVRRIEGGNIGSTNVSPDEKMASPERDKPRSLRKDGFAGTGRAAFPTNDGFAVRGRTN